MERLREFIAGKFPLAMLLTALWIAAPLPAVACGDIAPDPASTPPVVRVLAI